MVQVVGRFRNFSSTTDRRPIYLADTHDPPVVSFKQTKKHLNRSLWQEMAEIFKVAGLLSAAIVDLLLRLCRVSMENIQ